MIVVGFGQLSGEAASAGHSIPRDLSIKYSAKDKRFKVRAGEVSAVDAPAERADVRAYARVGSLSAGFAHGTRALDLER